MMFQQMNRGRASGFTFIDAKRDPGTLADIIMMALITGIFAVRLTLADYSGNAML